MVLEDNPTQGRKIRILRIITRVNVGGPAIQICNLLDFLGTDLFEQRLLFGVCESDEVDFLKSRNLNYPGRQIKTLRRSLNIRRDFISFIAICREIKAFRPDIVHTHLSKAGLLGRFATVMLSPRSSVIHTYHGLLFDSYFSASKTKILKFLERIISKRTNLLVAVGSKTKQVLMEQSIAPGEKIRVINPGIAFPIKSKSQLGIRPNTEPIRGLWIGRLTQIKRPDRLLEVIRIIKRNNLNITFRVAGTGSSLENFRNHADLEHLPVTFLGDVKQIDNEIKECDFLLCTSDNEGVPLALIQAQLHGKPIISTDVGSVSDVVEHGKSGYLANPNPEDLLLNIQKFLRTPDSMIDMGRKGKLHAENNFSLLRFIDDYRKLYLGVMKDINRDISEPKAPK